MCLSAVKGQDYDALSELEAALTNKARRLAWGEALADLKAAHLSDRPVKGVSWQWTGGLLVFEIDDHDLVVHDRQRSKTPRFTVLALQHRSQRDGLEAIARARISQPRIS